VTRFETACSGSWTDAPGFTDESLGITFWLRKADVEFDGRRT
jgi:hypothetical protein